MIKSILLMIFVLIITSNKSKASDKFKPNLKSQVTHSGITLYLNGEHDIIEFADKTFGIVVNEKNRVEIISMDPAPGTYLGRVVNGAMINPTAGTRKDSQGNPAPTTYLGGEFTSQGFHEGFEVTAEYDSANLYDSSLNAAAPLMSGDKIVLRAGQSFVATETRKITNTDMANPQYQDCFYGGQQNARAKLKNMAVFSIVKKRTAKDGEEFRATFYGHGKYLAEEGIDAPRIKVADTVTRALDDINYPGFVPAALNKDAPGTVLPDLGRLEEEALVQPKVTRLSNGWGATHETTCDFLSYGRNRVSSFLDGPLAVVYNLPRELRKKLLISIVQQGIDNVGRMQSVDAYGNISRGHCGGNGGHCLFGINTVFAGHIAQDSNMKNILLTAREDLGTAVTGLQAQMQVNGYVAKKCTGHNIPFIFIHTPNELLGKWPQATINSVQDCIQWGNNIVSIPMNQNISAYAYCCTANAISAGVALLRAFNLQHHIGNDGLVTYIQVYQMRAESIGWRFWHAWQARPYNDLMAMNL